MAQANQVKLTSIINTEKCKRRGFFESININSKKGKSYDTTIALRNFLEGFDYKKGDLNTIEGELDSLISDNVFITKSEKKAEVEIISKQVKRYLEYERTADRKLLLKDVSGYVPVDVFEVYVSADAVFENDGNIEIVKYKKGEPNLSYRARSFDKIPKNNIELFLMQKLGEKVFKKSKKPVVASYYFMKSKRDSRNEFIDVFERKDGDNIISVHFDIFDDEDKKAIKSIEKRIIELINTKLSFNSEKSCDENECRTCQFSMICNYEKPIQQELEKVELVSKSPNGTKIQLTESQQKLVDFDFGICRVNAGAGSGKSSTLVFRTIELIKKGYKPEDILLITFTNKGCQELKEKIAYWFKVNNIKNVNVNKIKIFTFNGFGEYILNEEFEHLGFEERPKLAEKVERYDLIIELLEEVEPINGLDYKNPLMDLPYAKGCVVELNNLFDKLKSKQFESIEEFATDIKKPLDFAERVWELYFMFCEALIERNLVQYQDQINYALQIFQAFPEIAKKYAVSHIMIDEFQDTDDVQMEFIKTLVRQMKFESLVVVGDDSQAIFGFRNVTPENIINFNDKFWSSTDLNLVDNFRSTPEIIATANLLNNKNVNKVNKNLISRRPSGKRPVLLQANTQDEEYEWIADKIEEKLVQGIVPHEIAVIARTRKELSEIAEYLKKRNIPVVIESTELLLENCNVKMILSFANFIENPNMDLGLLSYIMMYKKDEIEKMNAEEINDFVSKYKEKFLDSYNKLTTEEEKINYFFQTVEPIATEDENVYSFISHLKNKHFKTEKELVNYLQKFALYKDELTLVKDEIKYKAIVLTTAHSSKGKEFDVVFNTINKYKYSGKNIGQKEREEERRLLFVSITRAKDELYITYNIKAKKGYGFANELERVDTVKMAI